MGTYAVGDIQGCLRPLERLLRKVRFSPARDRLWCVGDLVNRGPDSLRTLRRLAELGDAAVVVLGNHDLHFLAASEGRAPASGLDALEELLAAPDCRELAGWLRGMPLAHCETLETAAGAERFLMVHAGVAPSWDLERTLALAGEAETALGGGGRRAFLEGMYGDAPARWDEGLEGRERLRAIVNHLTRIRFCAPDGALDLKVKDGPEAAPPGFRPWFEYEKITPEAVILFGHWAALNGRTGRDRVHALDTGCVWGRSLTMMRLEDGQRHAVES